jgi:hypothetical protein
MDRVALSFPEAGVIAVGVDEGPPEWQLHGRSNQGKETRGELVHLSAYAAFLTT